MNGMISLVSRMGVSLYLLTVDYSMVGTILSSLSVYKIFVVTALFPNPNVFMMV